MRALGLEGKVNPRRMLEESARDAILALLYAAPSKLVIIPIQDLFGWSARINRPGTISDSNWTYRIPLTLERMRRSRAIQSRVAKLREIAIKQRAVHVIKCETRGGFHTSLAVSGVEPMSLALTKLRPS